MISKGDVFILTESDGITLDFVDYVDDGEGMVFIARKGFIEKVENFSTESVNKHIKLGKMTKIGETA